MTRSNDSVRAKRGLRLERVVLLGRTFGEYRRYFLLKPEELIGKDVLDIAGGVSSFCAEANARGICVTSFDPIYSLSAEENAARSEPDLQSVYRIIGNVPTYRWSYYKSPERMREFCERSFSIFILDYKQHRERYIAGELPSLPFPDGSFDLTLISYFLFAYEERLTYEFHRDSILEIMRVTRDEARFIRTVTFEAQMSRYVPVPRSDPALQGVAFTDVTTDFEFLANSNSFLQVTAR